MNIRLVISEPEATNCFSINFQVFTNNNQLNFTKIHFDIHYHFRDSKSQPIRMQENR